MNFAVIAGGIKGKSAISADIFMQFNPFITGFSARAYLEVDAFLKSYTQTEIKGRLRANGQLDIGYNAKTNTFKADAILDMTFGITVKQWLPIVDWVEVYDGDFEAHLGIGTSGINFDFGKGNTLKTDCSLYGVENIVE
jgi:hypothetical protein